MAPLSSYMPALEEEMQRLVASDPRESPPSRKASSNGAATAPTLLYGMLRYHLGWVDESFEPATVDVGKRIRPTLLLLATEAQGGDWSQALPAAAAIELLHNFTLIHDDIEDRDELRRGRATLWKLWGVPQAINAGDALFALAYRALIGLAARGVPLERAVAALDRFTETVVAITEGQCCDLAFESQTETDEATYLAMIHRKTANLLGLAAEMGGLIAGASQPRIAALRTFGEALGMAFQMHDDILGLWGDPQRTGKPAGSDLQKGKKTLPILHGLRSGNTLHDILSRGRLTDADIAAALAELTRQRSRAYTEARATQYHAQAMQALQRSQGIGDAQEALQALALRLLNRDK